MPIRRNMDAEGALAERQVHDPDDGVGFGIIVAPAAVDLRADERLLDARRASGQCLFDDKTDEITQPLGIR